MTFQDTCIHLRGLSPFIQIGEDILCHRSKEFEECEYVGKWNECPAFKPVRVAMREVKKWRY